MGFQYQLISCKFPLAIIGQYISSLLACEPDAVDIFLEKVISRGLNPSFLIPYGQLDLRKSHLSVLCQLIEVQINLLVNPSSLH